MLSWSGRNTLSAFVLSFTQAVLVPTGVVVVVDEGDGELPHAARRRAPAASAARVAPARPPAPCRRFDRRFDATGCSVIDHRLYCQPRLSIERSGTEMSAKDPAQADGGADQHALGAALRRAWVGYRVRLDAEMAAAGFADSGLPDGRILHICAARGGVTISDVGRELGITRQGASKAVARLHERGYIELHPSPEDGREKVARLTRRAEAYRAAQRRANRNI